MTTDFGGKLTISERSWLNYCKLRWAEVRHILACRTCGEPIRRSGGTGGTSYRHLSSSRHRAVPAKSVVRR